MRQRNNTPPGAIKRTSAPPVANTPAVEDDELTVRVPSRNSAPFRGKRPPPLPNRKAHKIKRIKAQRSSAWAALDPEHGARPSSANAATTVVRREGVLIEAERERAELLHRRRERDGANANAVQHQSAPVPAQRVAVRPAVPAKATQKPDGRWLLLLKVGRDELAGIWDGSLASCEPIVWRPATKSWAPLFEVPQIATLVSASVKQRKAVARATAVPASPAPRRRLPSRVQPSERPRAPLQSERPLSDPEVKTVPRASSPPVSRFAGAQELKPSSLDEIGAHSTSGVPAARLALRSPYIPPPPRVPNLLVEAHAAFADDAELASVPALGHGLAPSEGQGTGGVAYEQEQGHDEQVRGHRTMRSQAPSTPAIDSLAPQARTLAPPAGSAAQVSVYERARWLMTGVAAALLLTTFTGAGTSLRQGLAGLIDPEPGGALASALGVEPEQSAQADSQKPRQPSAATAAENPAPATKEKSARRALSVEELPVLGSTAADAPATDDSERAGKAQGASLTAVASDQKRAATRITAAAGSSQRSTAPARPAKKPGAGAGFDAAQARRALATSVARAQFCAAERATGTVLVTFAPTGGVQGVSLASLSGDDVRKGCVVRAFRGARVSPFQGDAVTVQKSFRLR